MSYTKVASSHLNPDAKRLIRGRFVTCNAIVFTWTFMQAQQLKDKANSTMIPLAYSVSIRNKAGWSPNMKVHTCSFKQWYFQLSGTLGTLQPNKVECGEHYSSSSTQSNTLHGFKSFLTMISCHFGSLFKLILLSEATSVFSAAHEGILIMDVLFLCGSPRFCKLETHTHLQIWGTGGLQMSSLLKKSSIRTIKHFQWQIDRIWMNYVSQYNLTPGRGLNKHVNKTE